MLAVKTASASFRAQPSDKSAVVYSADKFYPVEVLERKNGWVKAKDFEGDTAWVAERSLGKMDTVVIDTPTANIRQKAQANGEVLFKVAHGEVFKVEDHHDHWLKVKDAHGDGGWIRADKTWGIEGEAKGLDKSAKADVEKGAHADENAKSARDDKKIADKKAEPNDKMSVELELVCAKKAEDKHGVFTAHCNLINPEKVSTEKASNEKAHGSHGKPAEAHVKKSQRPEHAKGNGHAKKSPRAQKKPLAQVRRKHK